MATKRKRSQPDATFDKTPRNANSIQMKEINTQKFAAGSKPASGQGPAIEAR